MFCHSAVAADDSVYFLALADIHFTPVSMCSSVRQRPCPLLQRLRTAPVYQWQMILAEQDNAAPSYRKDTNYVLLQKNLEAAAAAASKYKVDFVIVLGDTLGHDFRYYYKKYSQDKTQEGYRDFVRKTLEFMSAQLAAAFPGKNIFMVTGNNDTYSSNYQSVPGGDFFNQTGALWSALIRNAHDRVEMRSEFPIAGYYAVDVPGYSDLRLVVLNSVLFSSRAVGHGAERASAAELQWLHQQLQQAKDQHQKVLIAMHIPPVLDVYVTRRWRLFTLLEFWRPDMIQRFKNELAAYYPQVAGIVTGHLHYDWMQALIVGNHHDIPVISVPSVSPIFGNDPGFKIYHYSSSDNNIDDYYSYTLPVKGTGTWSIQHAYNIWRKAAAASP
ncbi:MAG TPA: metallophosphoesterase [Gammaproteobacteria bacterium]|jgi:hypothetical protein|nr:metallophosphoesterase [Gammaproteobacteria bacterium]